MGPTDHEDWEARLTIPVHEMDLILFAEVEAMQLADDGRVLAGFRVLVQGLSRARDEQSHGTAYGSELVRHWQRTLDNYTRRHGDVLVKW